MIQTVSRPFNDDFSYDLFCNLLKDCSYDYEAYYLWSAPPDVLRRFFKKTQFQAPNIIIGIKDLLDLWTDYNYWHDSQQAGVQLIANIVRQWPDKNFIIFTSLENLQLELTEPNVQIIPWGGDIVNQRSLYNTLEPVLEKNFDSTKTFISLNRNIRDHRVVMLSYLFGEGYDQYGIITYLGISNLNPNYEPVAFLDRISWEFDERHDRIRTSMLAGYEKVYMNSNLVVDNFQIYGEKSDNNNILNFNQCLRSKYDNSFVEIISESSFIAPSFMLTEKTHHGFYAFNFPILISGRGAVAHLREVGFDMFDDIVDHSYDLIDNPFDRITTAIDANQRLLIDSNYAKQLWSDNQPRFHKNLTVANAGMYEWYEARTKDKFSKIKWKT